jgi:hypothetical protein
MYNSQANVLNIAKLSRIQNAPFSISSLQRKTKNSPFFSSFSSTYIQVISKFKQFE